MKAQPLPSERSEESSITEYKVQGRSSQGYLDYSVRSRANLGQGRNGRIRVVRKDVFTLLLRD